MEKQGEKKCTISQTCCLPDELMEVDDDAERLSYLESSEWFVLEPTDTESSLTFFLLT